MTPDKAYGNIKIYSPSGDLMFLANDDKLRFYKKKDLIEQTTDGYRLKFEPKGLGHGSRNRELLEPRNNVCVVCGNNDLSLLTRHHIIPSRFRKFFPLNIKGNNHRYVVLLDVFHHDEYNTYENELNDKLAIELGVQTLKQCNEKIYIEKRIITGIANTILSNEDVPYERIQLLKEEFHARTGMEATEDNLLKVNKSRYEPECKDDNFGKLIVDKVKNIYDFQQMWLEHFVISMKPKFLPNDLKILLPNDILQSI